MGRAAVASIEEIKSGVNRFTVATKEQVAEIQAVRAQLEQDLALLITVTSGTGHPQITAAISSLKEIGTKLDNASKLATDAATTAGRYAASF
jgi:alanyl-tRNA synthetase